MQRARKLIATLALLIFITIYALGVMVFAVKLLPDASPWFEFVFYALAGLLWVIPAMIIVYFGWKGSEALTPSR